MQEFEELKQKVAEIEAEVVKADSGNRAAGVRVRKGMQEIKQLCQKVRDRILQDRDQSAGPA
ncbi:MAG TPA: histone H1 [Phycisphaerae bacterium]|nr:histone H1 [Phycisphaerae bacterium]